MLGGDFEEEDVKSIIPGITIVLFVLIAVVAFYVAFGDVILDIVIRLIT